MSFNSIVCPHCHKEIALTEALSHELDVKYEQKLQQEKRTLWEKAKSEAEKKYSEELSEKEKALTDARKLELELRREKRLVEDAKRDMEVTIARKLDEERGKIEEDALKRASQQQFLKQRELEKQRDDALKKAEDLRRQLQQGSQQTQGEVLELELESLLARSFPFDLISEVPKGVRGADIIHTVRDKNGTRCGEIIWELKRTKQWSDGWIPKLKDDQREVKAAVAVLVSEVLPKSITHFGLVQGVWVTAIENAVGLATALRSTLLQVAAIESSHVGKQEKMDMLYKYVTGVEFRQRVEAIVESFAAMHEELEQEKRAFERIWARREKQIQTVIGNTLGLHGELQGLLGGAIEDLKIAKLE